MKKLIMSASFLLASFVALISFPSINPASADCSCSSGSNGLCWVITVNGHESCECNSTSGSTTDCGTGGNQQ